jgi:hypothetical protein
LSRFIRRLREHVEHISGGRHSGLSKDSPDFRASVITLRQSNHIHSVLEEAARVRLSHIRYIHHGKGGGETSDKDHVFAQLAYESYLKPRPDVAASEYDNPHRAFIDKTLECSLMAYSLARG